MLDECATSLRAEPIPSTPTDDDYRQLAGQIREVARQTRLTVARNELFRLAADYDRCGDQFDRRAHYV